MSTATPKTYALEKTSSILGTVMMLAWTLGIGILGFVLLLAIAYAMTMQNQTLLIVCCVLIFAPLLITTVWGLFSAANHARKRWVTQYDVSDPNWCGERPGISQSYHP
jgi:amino acid transporter